MKLKINESRTLYEMANFGYNTTGEHFTLWIDEAGKLRKTSHDLPRFKPEANGVQIDIVIDNDIVDFDEKTKRNKRKLRKFKYSDDALEFVKKFKTPLLMHWNREIDTAQLGVIIRLVTKKNYTVDNAITAVLNDEY